MKKPISKTRRRKLNRFLSLTKPYGYDDAALIFGGILPKYGMKDYDYWIDKYYYICYGDRGKTYYGYKDAEPLTEEDYKYLRDLVTIDPFLKAEENEEFTS